MHRVVFLELFLGQENRQSHCFDKVSKRYECCGVERSGANGVDGQKVKRLHHCNILPSDSRLA